MLQIHDERVLCTFVKKTQLCYFKFYSVFYIVCFNVYSVFLNMNVHCLFTSKHCSQKFLQLKQSHGFTVLIVSKQLDSHPLPKVKENINRNCYWKQQAVKTHATCTRAALREIFINGCRVKQPRQGYQWDKNSHCRQGEKHSGRKRKMCFMNSRFSGFFSRSTLMDHSCILWDHVRNTINDGICNTKLFVY